MSVNQLDLKGETIYDIKTEMSDSGKYTKPVFYCISGKIFEMSHVQDCCETVELEDIVGDLDNLKYCEILEADEVVDVISNEEEWTYYKFSTKKGYVDLRWCGESNGYYSTSVNVFMIQDSNNLQNIVEKTMKYIGIDKESKLVKISMEYCYDEYYCIKCVQNNGIHLKATSTKGVDCFEEYIGEDIISVKDVKEEDVEYYYQTITIELETFEIILKFYCNKSEAMYSNNLIMFI